MKAISTIIASVLMLMIIIGLAGTSYLFISGTFTSKTATAFEIIESFNDTVTIRNGGTVTITSMTATLDGNLINIAIVPTMQGMVGYWSINDGSPSQTVTDATDNKNHGTLGSTTGSDVNDPSWVNGKYGNALLFDGINDYVNVGNAAILDINGNITFGAWFKSIGTALEEVIYSNVNGAVVKGTHVTILTNGNLHLYYNYNNNYYQVSSPVTKNQWHYVVFTFDTSTTTLKLYIDGVFKGQSNSPNAYGRSITNNIIGRRADVANGLFNGTIDEVMIFNRALSSEEITQIYSGLVTPGQLATVKLLTSLSKGTHTLRLCTSSMCNIAYLTIL